MRRGLATAMPEARRVAQKHPETVVHKDSGVPLRSRHGRQVFRRLKKNEFDSPTGVALRTFTLRTLIAHWIHSPRPENVAQPEVEFGKGDAHWWRVPLYDSALVSAADGSGKNIYTRDRAMFRRMLVDSWRLHRRLQRDWPRLSRQYRRALPELASEQQWRATFEELS
jgi:galactofuranosylgalactofuranosylrhamnosyl-N-acetylglucosaminyl-diphospho-decaprenol beta-1,5/1,6-galactofuranosyltransferase